MKKLTGYAAALHRNALRAEQLEKRLELRTRYAMDLEARLLEVRGAMKSLAKKGPTPEVRLFAAIVGQTVDLTKPFTPSGFTKKAKTL